MFGDFNGTNFSQYSDNFPLENGPNFDEEDGNFIYWLITLIFISNFLIKKSTIYKCSTKKLNYLIK